MPGKNTMQLPLDLNGISFPYTEINSIGFFPGREATTLKFLSDWANQRHAYTSADMKKGQWPWEKTNKGYINLKFQWLHAKFKHLAPDAFKEKLLCQSHVQTLIYERSQWTWKTRTSGSGKWFYGLGSHRIYYRFPKNTVLELETQEWKYVRVF